MKRIPHTEEICPHESKKYRKYLKRKQHRIRRRLGKILLQDAPVKNRYRGYSI